jgi:hypothetical protein
MDTSGNQGNDRIQLKRSHVVSHYMSRETGSINETSNSAGASLSAPATKGIRIMHHDIGKLEQRLRSVDERLGALEIYSPFGPIIHRPGWTTIAEYSLFNLAVHALEQHVNSIYSIRDGLLLAAEQVDSGPNSIPVPVGTGLGPGGRNP